MNKEMTLENWPLERLIPYARNPRKNDQAVEQIAAAIREFGFRVPVIAKSDGTIVDGHLRLKAAIKLGMTTIPVINADDMTDAQIKAFRISVNRMAELAEWDMDMLKLELEDLKEMDFDLELTGLDGDVIKDLLNAIEGTEGETDPDEVPEVPAEPVTRPGDLYLLGRHRLLCGDSTNITDVERLMDGKKADMVFTDPPYGVSYSDKNVFLNAMDKGCRIQKEIENDDRTPSEMKDFWVTVFSNLHLSTTDKASYYVTGPQGGELMMMMMMMMSLDLSGWQLKHMLIWAKNNHVLGRCDYHYKHEPILFGWKKKGTHEFFGNASNVSVWNIDKPLKSDLHPTMKPIEIMEKAINNSTKSGQSVLDLFLGSGSTLIACEKTGRTSFGMELDTHYCDVIVARWEKFTGKMAELQPHPHPDPPLEREGI